MVHVPEAAGVPAVLWRRRKPILYALVGGGAAVAVVVVLVLTGAIPLLENRPSKVSVQPVTLSFDPTNNPCFPSDFTNATPLVETAGGRVVLTVPLVDRSGGSVRDCTVSSVAATTAGFHVMSANVPLLVVPTGTTTLSVTVGLPSSAYAGALNLTANVTYVAQNVTVQNQTLTFENATAQASCGVSVPIASGFSAFGGSYYNDSVGFFVISPTRSCSVTGVTATTAGFTVVSSELPVLLPIDAAASVNLVLKVPENGYVGNLNLTLTLTWT